MALIDLPTEPGPLERRTYRPITAWSGNTLTVPGAIAGDVDSVFPGAVTYKLLEVDAAPNAPAAVTYEIGLSTPDVATLDIGQLTYIGDG